MSTISNNIKAVKISELLQKGGNFFSSFFVALLQMIYGEVGKWNNFRIIQLVFQ